MIRFSLHLKRKERRKFIKWWGNIQTHLITSSHLHSNSCDYQLLSPFKLTWSPAPISIQTHLITSSYLHSNSPDHQLLLPSKLTWSPAPITIQTHLITGICNLRPRGGQRSVHHSHDSFTVHGERCSFSREPVKTQQFAHHCALCWQTTFMQHQQHEKRKQCTQS